MLVDPESARAQWQQHDADVAARLSAIVDAYEGDPTRPLLEHVLAVLDVMELPIEILSFYFAAVDIYLRSRVKLDLVEALLHRPMLIWGAGWAALASKPGRAKFRPTIPATCAVATMRRAKIVLNPLPPYYESHERPLQAMANGAVAANGPSEFLYDAFPRGFLQLPAMPRAAAAVIEAFDDDDGLHTIAETGQRPAWPHIYRTIGHGSLLLSPPSERRAPSRASKPPSAECSARARESCGRRGVRACDPSRQ